MRMRYKRQFERVIVLDQNIEHDKIVTILNSVAFIRCDKQENRPAFEIVNKFFYTSFRSPTIGSQFHRSDPGRC
jgi:hypothetical protein